MTKNSPIIFQVRWERKLVFVLPFSKKLHRKKNGGLVDIKVNTEWHKRISPEEFHFETLPDKTYTILIKPHNDKYFAGWSRWFHWFKSDTFIRASLRRILSDPDYGYVKSETEIGNNFRREQYAMCPCLETIPPEDLNGDFTEIGTNFRFAQYLGLNRLQQIAKPSLPENIKKIGAGFRMAQYTTIENTLPSILFDLVNGLSYDVLFEKNLRIFSKVPEKYRNYEMCLAAISSPENTSVGILNSVPLKHKTEELCKAAVTMNGISLIGVPRKYKTPEICEIAVKQNPKAIEFVPKT